MRVAIADDSPFFRQGLAQLLAAAGHDVVLEASDGDEVLAWLSEAVSLPDIAVLDVWMPRTETEGGLRTAERIQERHPGLPLLMLSAHVQASYATRLMRRGNRGVGLLSKDAVSDVGTLVDALARVVAGEAVIDQEVVARLFALRRHEDALVQLTAREREVLRLMAEGRANRSIAAALNVSGRTVETHVASIFDKLGLATEGGDNRRVRAVLAWLRGQEAPEGSAFGR